MWDRLTQGWLGLHGLTFLTLSVLFFQDPETWGLVVSLAPTQPAGAAELMTLYGGLECGLGVVLLLGVLRKSFRTSALLVLMICYAGLAGGRLWGLTRFDLWEHPLSLQLFGIELLTALLSVALWASQGLRHE
jgi:hypothetical protein